MVDFGNKLKELRTQANMTQQQLADQMQKEKNLQI